MQTTNSFELRQDTFAPDLYLMGPYDHGAEQLRVNSYRFPVHVDADIMAVSRKQS